MTLTFPLPLAALSDIIPIGSIRLGLQQSDELSGTGDGRVWVAELAPPIWRAEITLARRAIPFAKQYVARIRALRGSREAFLLCDPTCLLPASDPTGAILGAAAVTISGIGGDRFAVSLAGLPAGYALTPGDKFSLTYGSAPTRYYYGEISEPKSANGSGAVSSIAVTPALPAGVAAGAAIRLRSPYLKAIIAPETFNPGTSSRIHTDGISFTALQQK